jgi:hypothetical protein
MRVLANPLLCAPVCGGGGGCFACACLCVLRQCVRAESVRARVCACAEFSCVQPSGAWQWGSASDGNGSSDFTTQDPRPLQWAGVPDVWMSGYWSFDWAQSFVEVESIVKAADGVQ